METSNGPASINDSYFGLRDVMMEILNNQVTAIVLGGTQDLTQGIYMAFELVSESVNVVSIDSRLDLETGSVHSTSWLSHVVNRQKTIWLYHHGSSAIPYKQQAAGRV